MTETSDSMHTIRGAIVFGFAVALLLFLAWTVRSFLVLLYVSALFAVVLTPVVRATAKIRIYKWRPFQGAAAIFILLLAAAMVITIFGFLALPPVIRDLQSLSGEMPARIPVLLDRIKQIPFANRLESADVIAWMQNSLSGVLAYLLLSIKDWAGVILDVIAGFVMTLYFILEGDRAYRWFLSFLPRQPRERLDRTLQSAAGRMQKWLVGQLCLMLILGALSTAVYLTFHVRYAYALGVLTGLLNVVPVLGAAVSIALALLVAAVDSWVAVIGISVFYVIYLQLENSFLIPHIMKNRVNLPALAIFAALLLGAELEGVVGAMVSIPTAVLVSVLLDEYLVRKD